MLMVCLFMNVAVHYHMSTLSGNANGAVVNLSLNIKTISVALKNASKIMANLRLTTSTTAIVTQGYSRIRGF